jgi:hypothetical protein
MKFHKPFVVIALYLCSMTALAAGPNQNIVDAFENIKVFYAKQSFAGQALSAISDAEIYEASYGFGFQDPNDTIALTNYFLKGQDSFILFDTYYQLFSSPEFIASLHSDFYLKTLKDGLAFQSFLFAVDNNHFNEGFFIEGNTWYFVRDDFFDDLEAWIVETKDDGTVLSIRHDYDADITMGDYVFEVGNQDQYYEEDQSLPIDAEDLLSMQAMMVDKLNYEIEVSKLSSPQLNKVSNANWYDCYITIIEEDEDITFSSTEEVWGLEREGRVHFFATIQELLSSPVFFENLQPDFLLSDDVAAEQFEQALDDVSDFVRKEKSRFFRDDAWYFIRSQPFSDGRGFVVHTDEAGHITSIEFSYYISKEVVAQEVFDETNVVWTFDLIEPQETFLQVPVGESIPVTIEFNEAAASHYGAWIGTFQEGDLVGMYASTSMESPFTDTIPGEFLLLGENDISYRLLNAGDDYENPIARIDFSILVVEAE